MTRCVAASLFAILLSAAVAGAQNADDFRPLFSDDLSGWKQVGGGQWRIEDGVVVGRHKKSDPRHGHLLSDQEYGDFTIRLEFKALEGNSGLYFRVEPVEGNVGVHGFQAEIDARKDVGGLYETGGRAWVVQPTAEEVARFFKPGEWNQMTVKAKGRDVTVTVNGEKTAELVDDPGRTRGHLALQLHGSQDVYVMFRNVEIRGEPLQQ